MQNPCYKHTTKVMNANELRIGNFVYSKNDGIIKITNISEKSVAVSECHSYNHIPINFISPIQLTEDWLLNFGFMIHKHRDFPSYGLSGIQINYINGKWHEYVRQIDIISVHQLQNLYFALTQNELTLS